MNKPTKRERWLMREAWAWGQFSKSERSPAFGQTFSQWLAQAEDRLREQAPQSKIRIDAMDAWVEEQGTGIDEGEA